MGQVFLAATSDGDLAAVKVIRPEFARNPSFRRRFAREVSAARRVGGLHTASVVDADPEAAAPWLATEYIPGPSLQDRVAQRGPLDPTGVLTLASGLAEGLAAIHACRLAHRDLKPGNVILAEDGPRIIDFGIAQAHDASTLTTTGVVVGTYAYMAPEQVHGEQASPASDIFSLGAVLTFAATGRSPFEAPSILAIARRIADEAPNLDGIPSDLRKLIQNCLNKAPNDRPAPSAISAQAKSALLADPSSPPPKHKSTNPAIHSKGSGYTPTEKSTSPKPATASPKVPTKTTASQLKTWGVAAALLIGSISGVLAYLNRDQHGTPLPDKYVGTWTTTGLGLSSPADVSLRLSPGYAGDQLGKFHTTFTRGTDTVPCSYHLKMTRNDGAWAFFDATPVANPASECATLTTIQVEIFRNEKQLTYIPNAHDDGVDVLNKS